jgi:hypothetical protein
VNKFIGTKIIAAIAMTRLAYNDYRGWTLPANENGADTGYLVEYLDGGKGNDSRHAGYISWSPKEVFDRAYKPVTAMSFGDAILLLKAGHRVARAGWNGKGMWLSLTEGQNYVPAEKFWSPHNRAFAESNGGHAEVQPYITMKTAQGKIVPWLASQSDMLDEDWQVVE